MKVQITWQIHEGKLHDTLALFSQMDPGHESAMMGEEVKLLSRWHDLVRGTGVAIYDVASAEALSAFSLNWNRYMDLDIAVVVDDDAARSIGSQLPAED